MSFSRLFAAAAISIALLPHPLLAQGRGRLTPYHQLKWEEFPVNDGADPAIEAHTGARISYQYRSNVTGRAGIYTATIASLSIQSGFDRGVSWRRSQLVGDPANLLKHEQGHLDINEIQAASLRRLKPSQLPQGTGFSPQAASHDLDERLRELFNGKIAAAQREQDDYDRDTDHGRNPEMQKKWSERLARDKAKVGIR